MRKGPKKVQKKKKKIQRTTITSVWKITPRVEKAEANTDGRRIPGTGTGHARSEGDRRVPKAKDP